MKRALGIGGVAAVGAALLLASPANAQTLDPSIGTSATSSAVIHVPSSFDQSLSDTRANGHYAVQGTALHIFTDSSSDVDSAGHSTDKVAEYVDTNTPLATVGEPSLDYTSNVSATHIPAGVAPGYQLVVDFNNDGTPDGTLVGESVYGNDWWLTTGSEQFVKDAAPSNTGGSGSDDHGTLDQWRAAFPTATVRAFGFSLGSGVYGDGLINSLSFAGTTYTFAADVTLDSKDQCKLGGWATSTVPIYKNQGECVSHFVSKK